MNPMLRPAIVLLALLQPACSLLEEAPPAGVAAPVEEWQGLFNNVYRDGDVYFAGLPTQGGLERAADEGVTTVVSLLSEQEEAERLGFDERSLLAQREVQFVRIPISPETFSRQDVDAFARALEEADGKVLVHCASANRVGGLWAAYVQRERGVTVAEAQGAGHHAGLRSESMVEAFRRVAAQP